MTAEKFFPALNEKLNALKDKRITVVFFGEFGTVDILHFNLDGSRLASYAQYENGIVITGKKRSARRLSTWHFYEAKTFAIFSGWHIPEKEMPNSWRCFDKAVFYSVVDSIPERFKLGEWSERTQPVNTAAPLYEVCRIPDEQHPDSVEHYETVEALTAAYTQTGTLCDNIRRRELQGQPYLEGLCGPMYNGLDNGRPVIRYETVELNRILSS